MSDLDFVVNTNFAMGTDQSRAARVFAHELGHGHMLNHARCFGFACEGPLMHPQGETDIKDVDKDGGNEIFGDSETIINNGCQSGGNAAILVRIQSGGCGTVVSTKELVSLKLELSPNPTSGFISVADIKQTSQYLLTNSTGQLLNSGETHTRKLDLDLSSYPSGTYFLTISNDKGIGHLKIIKL